MSQKVIANTPEFYLFDLQKIVESEYMIFGADYILIQPSCEGCMLHLAEKSYTLSSNQAVLLSPFNPFRLTCATEKKKEINQSFNILHFTLHSLGQTFVDSIQFSNIREVLERSKRGILFTGEVTVQVRQLINEMRNTLEFSNVINFLSLLNKLSESNEYILLLNESIEITSAKKNEDRLKVAVDYIKENLSEPLSVAIVSEKIHMAESTFSRFFHANKGITFKQYLIEQRVRQAARLLVATDWSIAQIGAEVGFASLSNFNSKFKGLLNVTPKQYRQNHIDMRQGMTQSKTIEGQVQRQYRNAALSASFY